MRNLKEHPVTEQEISECLKELTNKIGEEDKIGDIRPLLLRAADTRVSRFTEAILHGSSEHRAWLIEAAYCFMHDQPMPPARG